jgi:hypothetical protein
LPESRNGRQAPRAGNRGPAISGIFIHAGTDALGLPSVNKKCVPAVVTLVMHLFLASMRAHAFG